jgi:hypothetical protein
MKQFAAMMMFAAWLLYGAMPAMAMPSMPHALSDPAMMAVAGGSVQPDHSGHGGMSHDPVQNNPGQNMASAGASALHDDMSEPCPHSGPGGAKICVAPFCSACLVVLPDIAFADPGRFVHRYPAPEAGPSLIASGRAPLTPPPRA